MAEEGLKRYFGANLAKMLAEKITAVYPSFQSKAFINDTKVSVTPLELVARTALIASLLHKYLPQDYKKALPILLKILGPENEKETGMFTTGYWLWPVAKFIELYGVDYFNESMHAIKEITTRHTGEYAIRPFIKTYPDKTLPELKIWAKSTNPHVRRLASEGLRPLLPWSQKLVLFIDNPQPVFEVLETLKDDPSRYVQKSVANNINDYIKVNRPEAYKLLKAWAKHPTEQRTWIIKHALRNELKKEAPEALGILR